MSNTIGLNPFNVIYKEVRDDDENDYEREVSAIEIQGKGIILRSYTRDFETATETITFIENVTIEDINVNKTE